MIRRALWGTLICLYFAYVLAPIILLFVGSFGEKWFGTLLPSGFTWRWYVDLFSKTMYVRAMTMSLLVASLSAVLNAIIGIPAV